MLMVFLMALVWILCSAKLNDPDIWWHLRHAEDLLNSRHVPTHDIYSFTVEGRERINHEWLAAIPYYFAWRIGGLVGIHVLRLTLAELITLGLLYLAYRASGNIKASIFACGFCVFFTAVTFEPRMILFGYLYLVVLLIILERFSRTGDAAIWLVPFLFCLWVNTHGSWLLGFAVFGIIALAGAVEGNWGRIYSIRWTPKQMRTLIGAGAASVIALLLNPYGWKLPGYAITYQSRMQNAVTNIVEFASVNFHDFTGKWTILFVFLLLLMAMLRNTTWKLSDVALLLFALYLGLNYVRFLVLVAIVGTPVLAKLFDFIPPYEADIDKPLVNAIFMAAVVLVLVFAIPLPTEARLQKDVSEEFPTEAVSFLQTHPPEGRVFNAFPWGGYLSWRTPGLKVFIDSRVDVFEDAGVFADYLNAAALNKPYSILDKYKIRYVLFGRDEPLTRLLESDRNWKLDYRDDISMLFERIGVSPN